jgi:hypothetical protein
LARRNSEKVAEDERMWGITAGGMARMYVTRNQSGAKPKFTHSQAQGGYYRQPGKGGID